MSDVKLKKISIMKKEIERQYREKIIDASTRDSLLLRVSDYVDREVYYEVFVLLRKIDRDLEEKGAYAKPSNF